MIEVALNEPEKQSIELIRAALSEESDDLRERAIKNVKHEVVGTRLESLFAALGAEGVADPANTAFIQWVATSSLARTEAAYELSETGLRYKNTNERKLSLAEEIGFLIFSSIQDRDFRGVHTKRGILEQISHVAREDGARGAKDNEVLAKLWKTYKGVVHLGMAIKWAEENPGQPFEVLELAECFRMKLSENCPKGTQKPYVDPDVQFCFIYKSRVWGPRFQNRGLSFEVI